MTSTETITVNGFRFTITTTTTTRRRPGTVETPLGPLPKSAIPATEAEWEEARKRRDAFRRLNGDRDDEAERRRQTKMGAWIRERARRSCPAAPVLVSRAAAVSVASRSRSGRAPHRQATRGRSPGGTDLPSSDDPDPPPKEKAPWPGALSETTDDPPRVAESGARLKVAGSARARARRAGGVERLRAGGRP